MGIISDALKKLIEEPTLRISMMGPRGVGKTSVLTSIFRESSENIAGSTLYLRAGNATSGLLTSTRLKLSDAFESKNAANLPASSTEEQFLFEIGRKGRAPSVKLIVHDFPGEYLTSSDANKNEAVSTFIRESNIILVAIDTPYLMEEKGKYNEQKNEIGLVSDYFIKNADSFKNKLVLFIPLKCELYFHNDTIENVTREVEHAYGNLLPFFRDNNIASVVCPIQTLGDIDYTNMIDNPIPMSGVKKIAQYEFRGANPEYSPRYCSQPLYYLLTYAVNYYEWSSKHPTGAFFERMFSAIRSLFKNDTDFFLEAKKLNRYIINDETKFKVLVENTIFKIN